MEGMEMALFDDIKKKVTDTTQGAVKATKELAETARLNSQISEAQRKLANLQSQLGRMYFEKYGAEAEPPFNEICTAIIAANEQIAKLQLDIQMVKGVKHCPNCGNDVPMSSAFCGKCGSAVANPAQVQPVEAVEVLRCVHCGEELESGSLFCGSCGQRQEHRV
jgi:predicted nucleic acid-binding Zn ribbon protein